MIRRLQPGYNGGVVALHSHSDDKPKTRYCQRCEDLFQVHARLGPKILLPGVPKPSDYDLWLECRNCCTVYPKHEVKIEPELVPLVKPGSNKGKLRGIEKRKRPKGRGYNPRVKGNKWEIKDSDLNAELKSGSVLLAYSSNDPSEPVV